MSDSFSKSSFWRIFPPPTADRKRTNKKTKKKHQRQQQETNSDCHADETQKQIPSEQQQQHQDAQTKTELWRQKQQQYQYTYPYRVDDPVIIMTSPHHNENEDTEHRTKRPKISSTTSANGVAGDLENTSMSNGDTAPAGCGGGSQLVPMPGRIVEITNDEQKGMFFHVKVGESDGAIRILSPKEQRKLLRPDLSLPYRQHTAQESKLNSQNNVVVVLVEETLPFRQFVRFQLHNDAIATERVLEIGCSTGELSRLIWNNYRQSCSKSSRARPSWIGMDHSQEMIDKCAEKLQKSQQQKQRDYHTKLVKVDALAEPQKAVREATLEGNLAPTVVLIDIGGNRECGPVVRTISWVLESFGGNDMEAGENADNGGNHNSLRMVIVKSRALVRRLLSDCEDMNAGTDGDDNTKNSPVVSVDPATGTIANGSEWFTLTLQKLMAESTDNSSGMSTRFKHPLKAPMVFSPVDEQTPICRYHNYHRNGCKLYEKTKGNKKNSTCHFDHDHCHACRQHGHIARNCSKHGTQHTCY